MKPNSSTVKKALIYALRFRSELEVLIFDHVKYPEVSPQVPAGTIEENEDPLAGAQREFFEETGFHTNQSLSLIGTYPFLKETTNQIHHRHVYIFNGSHLPEEWVHTVTGNGEDENLQFRYYWLPVKIAQEKLQANLGDGFRMFAEKIKDVW